MIAVHIAHINGRTDELSAYLETVNHGISLQGVVIAGMVIGALGVPLNTALTQASAVMALRRADPTLTPNGLYRAAFHVGRAPPLRDHPHARARIRRSVATTAPDYHATRIGFLAEPLDTRRHRRARPRLTPDRLHRPRLRRPAHNPGSHRYSSPASQPPRSATDTHTTTHLTARPPAAYPVLDRRIATRSAHATPKLDASTTRRTHPTTSSSECSTSP